jgi:hypothetical protein
MVGGLAGAFQGTKALGSDWIGKATATVPGQDDLALKLAAVTVSKAERAAQAAAAVALLHR